MRKRMIRAFSLLLACALLMSAPAYAAPTSNLSGRILSIQNERTKLAEQLSELEMEEADSREELRLINEQIALIDKEFAYQSALADIYGGSVAAIKQQLTDTQTEESEKFNHMKHVLREMEEAPSTSFWGIIFNVSSITDAIARIEFYNSIVRYEKAMLADIASKREELSTLRYDLRMEEAEYTEAKNALEKQREALEKENRKLQDRLDELSLKSEELSELFSMYASTAALTDGNDLMLHVLTQAEIDDLLSSALVELQFAKVPQAETELRLAVLRAGLGLVGKVPYFWGGRVYSPGWNSEWGTSKTIQHAGNSKYPLGQSFPYGLDCSGFVFWCALTAYNTDSWDSPVEWMADKGATMMYEKSEKVAWTEKLPADIVVNSPITHIGYYICSNEKGEPLFLHCSSNYGVVVSTSAACNFVNSGRIFSDFAIA